MVPCTKTVLYRDESSTIQWIHPMTQVKSQNIKENIRVIYYFTTYFINY